MVIFNNIKILIAGFIVFGILLFAPQAFAKELVKEADLNLEAVRAGYTVETEDKVFAVGIQSEAAAVPLRVEIKKIAKDELPAKQGNYIRVSDVYEFNVKP